MEEGCQPSEVSGTAAQPGAAAAQHASPSPIRVPSRVLSCSQGQGAAHGSWPCQHWAQRAPVPAAEGAQSRYLYQSLNCFNYPHLSHPQPCFIKACSPADKWPFVLLQSLSTGNCQVPINQQLLLRGGEMKRGCCPPHGLSTGRWGRRQPRGCCREQQVCVVSHPRGILHPPVPQMDGCSQQVKAMPRPACASRPPLLGAQCEMGSKDDLK